MKKNVHIKTSRRPVIVGKPSSDGRKKKPKIFNIPIPTKFSKELKSAIDYVINNYHFKGKRVYLSRSSFIRSACINMLRLKLGEMGEDVRAKRV